MHVAIGPRLLARAVYGAALCRDKPFHESRGLDAQGNSRHCLVSSKELFVEVPSPGCLRALHAAHGDPRIFHWLSSMKLRLLAGGDRQGLASQYAVDFHPLCISCPAPIQCLDISGEMDLGSEGSIS